MDTKLQRKVQQTSKPTKADQHIPPIAGTIFGIVLLIAIFGAIFGDGRFSDTAIGAWVTVWMLIGIYILFALKVASQWEKAVVLRLGKFYKLSGPGPFWIILRNPRNSIPYATAPRHWP